MNETNETLRQNSVDGDAKVIAASLRFCEAAWRIDSFYKMGEHRIEDDKELRKAEKPYRDIMEQLLEILADVDLRASTLEGMQARARAAVAAASGDYIQEGDGSHEIVACLLNDLLGAGSYSITAYDLIDGVPGPELVIT